MAVLFLLLFAAIAKSAEPLEPEGYFEPNLGQAHAGIQFLGRSGSGLTLFDSRTAILLLSQGGRRDALRIQPGDLAHDLLFEPDSDVLRGVSAYFRGSDPARWIPKVPHYSRIRARDAWPGVDLIYYWTSSGQLEYDFVLKPGVDPAEIRMRFSSRLSLDPDGSLLLHTALGELRQPPPRVYQSDGREIAAAYRIDGPHSAAFEIAPYDRALELVIDPVIQFSTFLGSSEAESLGGIASGSSGSIYVVGTAGSVESPETAFPTTNAWTPGGGFHRGGGTDAFVSRLDWDAARNRRSPAISVPSGRASTG